MILFYRRGDFCFLVNLNPIRSFTDYGLPVVEGEFELILNTDSRKYDGFGRVGDKLTLVSERGADRTQGLKIYLPSRTGMVFRKTSK